jgi:hypothetical protein
MWIPRKSWLAAPVILAACTSTVPQVSGVRIPAPGAELTTPCVGPSELTSPIRESALLRDRANHRICVDRHAALAGWAQAVRGAAP